MQRSKKTVSPEAAKIRMASLCAKSEQCEHDIAEKLYKLGIAAAERAEILEFLIRERFIDNARFARSFAYDKMAFSGWGRQKIRYALALKKIERDLIQEAVEELDEERYEEILELHIRQKMRSLDIHSYDHRMKIFRSLASKGFESQLISRMIGKISREGSDED